MNNRVIRRVTKRTYDNYATVEYSTFSDNLNPLNPTNLETQVSGITRSVKEKVIEAYTKANVEVPEELFQPDVSATSMLNAVDELIKRASKDALTDLIDDLGGNTGVVPALISNAGRRKKDKNSLGNAFLDNPFKLDCDGVKIPSDLNTNAANDTDWKITYIGLLDEADKEFLPDTYKTVDCPKKIDDPATTSYGEEKYEFKGWYLDSEFESPLANNTIPENTAGDIKLFAWFRNINATGEDAAPFSITYVGLLNNIDNDGVGPSSYDPFYTGYPTIGTPSTLSKGGKNYIFKGWFWDPAYTDAFENNDFRKKEEDVTFYAQLVEDATESSSKNGDDEKEYNIIYKGLLNEGDAENWKKTYKQVDGEITLETPTTFNLGAVNYTFGGWYFDEYFNEKVKENKFTGKNADVTVWALFEETDDSSDDNNEIEDGGDLAPPDNDNECDLLELSILKVILIIIVIVGILVKVLVLVYNIMKAAADIAKDAQLCWINPPSLQSLISYVMQRLTAIIFQIVGIILLKLWALLNLDCISDNAAEVLDQVNEALSGLMNLLGQIDSLAIDFKGAGTDFASSIREAIKAMKEQITDAAKEVENEFKNLPNSMLQDLKTAGADIADTYTNPATYLAMVPPEIRNKVMGVINNFNKTKETVKSTVQAIQKTKAVLSRAPVQDPPKGTEVTTIL